MFDIHKEVPDLELCKRLKQLGYPQDTGGWYWRDGAIKTVLGLLVDRNDLGWILIENIDGMWMRSPYIHGRELKKLIKAPTMRELGEAIPYRFPSLGNLRIGKTEDGYYYCYFSSTETSSYVYDELEANARAKLLIWLIENGYIKYDDNK